MTEPNDNAEVIAHIPSNHYLHLHTKNPFPLCLLHKNLRFTLVNHLDLQISEIDKKILAFEESKNLDLILCR